MAGFNKKEKEGKRWVDIISSLSCCQMSVFQETMLRKLRSKHRAQCPPFVGDDPGCTSQCIPYFYADEISRLCRGDKTLRPPEKDARIKCELLHYNSPFLRLNPFKLETANNEGNFVAIVHHLLSAEEVEEMKLKAIGDLKATPYSVGGVTEDYSYKRNSKIKYISERTDSLALAISRRMEDALAFHIYQPEQRFTAENYQVRAQYVQSGAGCTPGQRLRSYAIKIQHLKAPNDP